MNQATTIPAPNYLPAMLKMHVEGKVRFVDEANEELPVSLVMSQFGLLPVIASLADKMGRDMMGISIDPEIVESDDGLTGFRCRLTQPLTGDRLWLMLLALECLCGVGRDDIEITERSVDVSLIIDYLSTPPEERSADKCPWNTVHMLP